MRSSCWSAAARPSWRSRSCSRLSDSARRPRSRAAAARSAPTAAPRLVVRDGLQEPARSGRDERAEPRTPPSATDKPRRVDPPVQELAQSWHTCGDSPIDGSRMASGAVEEPRRVVENGARPVRSGEGACEDPDAETGSLHHRADEPQAGRSCVGGRAGAGSRSGLVHPLPFAGCGASRRTAPARCRAGVQASGRSRRILLS